MKIAVIAPSAIAVRGDLPYGGAEWIIWQLCKQLARHDHEVTLIAPRGSDAPGTVLFQTVEPDKSGDEWGAFEEYEYAFDYSKDFDVVHDHSHHALPYKLRCLHPNLRMVHTCHGLQTWGYHVPFPVFYGPARLLTLSTFHQDITKQPHGSCAGAMGMNSRTVIHGIDTDVYRPCDRAVVSDYFLVFGLMAPHKGHTLPLKIWSDRKMANMSTGPLIVAGEDNFVGDKKYVRTIKELCEGPTAKPVANYIGGISQEKKIELFQRARGVMLPFITKPGEAWSLIALEAQACGCPVISTPNGAIPELIEQDKTGFICKDDKALIEAMEKCETLDREYIASRIRVRFGLNSLYDSHMAIYEAILKGDTW